MFYDFLYTTTVMGLCASELRMVCVPLSESQGPKDVHPKLSLLCLLLTVPDEILLNEASAQFSCVFSKKKTKSLKHDQNGKRMKSSFTVNTQLIYKGVISDYSGIRTHFK